LVIYWHKPPRLVLNKIEELVNNLRTRYNEDSQGAQKGAPNPAGGLEG